MTDRFDIVIAGAGHNSLITSAYLARAGFSCLILEALPEVDGNTMTEELTLPGFLHDTCSTSHSIFMESPIWRNQELSLAEYGLEYIRVDPASHVVFPGGPTSRSGSISTARARRSPSSPERMPLPIAG